MRAPVRRGARGLRSCLLPVGDQAMVSALGLGGELPIAVADLLQEVGPGRLAALALAARGAGEQLEPAQLGGGQ
jgi:hypothetical protein